MNKQILKKKSVLLTLPLATFGLLAATPSSADGLFGSLIETVRTGASSIPFMGRGPEQRPVQIESQPAAVPIIASDAISQTSDSSVLIRETVDPASVLMNVEITPKDQSQLREILFVHLDQGQMDKRIYLLHGAGTYHINMWQSRDPSPYQRGDQMVFVKGFDVTNTDTRDMSFLLPSGDVESDSPEIIALAKDITANSQNDAEKALAIHDWVAGNIAYDADAYFSGTYVSKVFDALGALHSRLSVCQGYSSLYAALARAAGLRAKVVDGAIIWPGQTWEQLGTKQTHAWNEVLVDGRWITLDTTWDAGYMNFTTHQFSPALMHKYYDPNSDQFAVDHRKLKDNLSQ